MKRFLALIFAIVLVSAACAGSDGDEVLGTTDEPTPTSLATTAPVTDEPSASGVTVGELLAGEPGDVVVSGAVVWVGSLARLCDVLMESFPPQCGEPSVVITNAEQLTVELEESGGVRWTDTWVDLEGFFDGDEFTLGAGVTVSQLLNGQGQREAIVSAAVVWDGTSARLCDVLMESFPPQCGSPWVVIANPEQLSVELEESGGVRWTDTWVDLAGLFDGERFILNFMDPAIDVTAADETLVAALVGFARSSDADDLAAVALGEMVALGLGPEIVKTVDRATLADPATWLIERDEFRAWSGPFSVLDLAAAPYQITIGAHNRCASPPEPAPTGFEDLRRVSIQPSNASSCLEWWTVDLFVEDSGDIQAITLDLFAP